MPWVKFTDDWYDDEDMADASPLAVAMWAVAITWSARNLTDGRIPRSQVRKLLDLEHESLEGANCRADDIAAELVRLNRWTPTERGFLIRNYHRFQPTREKVLADRDKDRKRKSSRPGDLVADGTFPNGIRPESNTEGEWNPECPVPVPDVSVLSSSGNSQGTSPPVDNPDDDGISSNVPDEVWAHYAERKLARQPAGKVDNTIAWKLKTGDNARTEHHETAERWWSEFDVTPQHLAQCLVDGKAPAAHYRRKDPMTVSHRGRTDD